MNVCSFSLNLCVFTTVCVCVCVCVHYCVCTVCVSTAPSVCTWMGQKMGFTASYTLYNCVFDK